MSTGYSLEPWVYKALRLLPTHKRILTRLKINHYLKRASKQDEIIAGISNRMDCGWELADHITGGKLSRAEKKRDEIISTKIEPIMTELKGIYVESQQSRFDEGI